MSEDKALVPVEQRQVIFYEDEITAVRLDDNRIMIPLRPICDLLGLAWSSQLQRIRRDPVLEAELVSVFITNTESQRGGRSVQCLPLDMLHGFLFGINANRVKPALQERVIRYQRECYRVLAEAFREGRLTADPTFEELLRQDSEAVEAYKMLQAMIKLARNQILVQSQLDSQQQQLAVHDQRLELIESQLGDETRTIAQDQAVQISQAVKAIAMVWSKQAKDNKYGAVYGRLYQRFNITSYKLLPATKFKEAMNWLTQWYMELTGEDTVPF